MTDPFDPQRFLDAQSSVYPLVLDELRRGRKQSHWMWFIFPQLAGLGHSAMAQRFAIAQMRGRDVDDFCVREAGCKRGNTGRKRS